MARFREDETRHSLDDLEPGKVCGAVVPLSEQARTQVRDTMEVIEYLLNHERVVCN